MDTHDREEIAAAMAGMHNLFGLLVHRLDASGHLDMADLLTDMDALMAVPGLHPVTRAVQEDARETVLGLLGATAAGRDLLRAPRAIGQVDLPNVAPLRRSPLPGEAK